MAQNEIKLTLTLQGAEELRKLAKTLPSEMSNMIDATASLRSTLNSLSEDLGVHEEDYDAMLIQISKAQFRAQEALEVLIPKMEATAEKIEMFVRKRPSLEKSGNLKKK